MVIMMSRDIYIHASNINILSYIYTLLFNNDWINKYLHKGHYIMLVKIKLLIVEK